jgi:hypothetical protein
MVMTTGPLHSHNAWLTPGPHFAAKEKKYLKQPGVRVPVDMPVVQAAAGFYQLYVNEFGVVRLCLLAIQGELGNLGGERSGGGWHGCDLVVCRNSTSFKNFHPFFLRRTGATMQAYLNHIGDTPCVPK